MNALNCGTPQMKTKTERMTQGSHAFITAARESRSVGCSCSSSTRSLDDQSRGASVIGCLGCQTRRKRARQTIEMMAATMSTSHGPWKLETRYCGTAKEMPATSNAGKTSD